MQDEKFAHIFPSLISIAEAQRLGGNESRASVYRALAAGELQGVKRGRRTLITVESCLRRLKELPAAKFASASKKHPLGNANGGADIPHGA